MSKLHIKSLVASQLPSDGMMETGIPGVHVFRVSEPILCAPAVYEPSVTAILSGAKEAIWDGTKQIFDSSRYVACTLSLPIETGTPHSSPDNPLLGVYISLNTRVMTELVLEMEAQADSPLRQDASAASKGLSVSNWDADFTEALWRVLQLSGKPVETQVLGRGRLRELYFAILRGESGEAVRRAFGVGNEIARSIEFLSSHLHESITIDDLACKAGMSRAVFHRKFKLATGMSPIQFLKAMRLNRAAMEIVKGTHVNVAALAMGYTSSSQFSREFKRMYGTSPKQWSQSQHMSAHGLN